MKRRLYSPPIAFMKSAECMTRFGIAISTLCAASATSPRCQANAVRISFTRAIGLNDPSNT